MSVDPGPTNWAFGRMGKILTFKKELILRRVFSTFAHGGPGAGLLVMRLVASIAYRRGAYEVPERARDRTGGHPNPLRSYRGNLATAGLWTPIMGVLVAVIEMWSAYSQPGDR